MPTMIQILLREAVLTALLLLLVSLAGFVVLDATGAHDWWGTLEPAARAGVPREQALARALPVVWNRRVADARVRTLDDLEALARPESRAAARRRLERRGTAALPTILAQLRHLAPEARDEALAVLASMAPHLGESERPPADSIAALEYWDRFVSLHALEFRQAYARRLVQRLVEHESANAAEHLARLGTFALPALFEVMDGPLDTDAARRLTDLLTELTGRPLRVPANASVHETREIVEAWRAWWFAERLEYEQLTGTAHALAHLGETRYGRWVARALVGRLGVSAVTRQPIALELRRRLPASMFVAGLGGLIATALVVAFGGGAALRRRPLRTKLLDLVGALVPGLGAFVMCFALLVQVCAAPRPAAPLAREVLSDWPRLVLGVVLAVPLAVLWLRRRAARVTLHAVRLEAESWARRGLSPRVGQIVRHGFRVGVASLFAPIGLSAQAGVAISMLVEPITGVQGMAGLTVASARRWDAPWLLIGLLTMVPLMLAARWARSVMIWALGASTRMASRDPAVQTGPRRAAAMRPNPLPNDAGSDASHENREPASPPPA